MRRTEIRREFESDSVRLRLLGGLDGRTARQLRLELDLLPRNRDVIIDFSGVAPFSDLAVAVLAQELRATRRTLDFVGITKHQERLFRYFGVPLAPSQPVADETYG